MTHAFGHCRKGGGVSFHYEEIEGKYFHLTLCTDCDYLVHKNTFFKVREYNVFLYQNIIMHYKYINIIVKQFTHFCRIFGSVDLRAFSPRPADFPLRPADFHPRPVKCATLCAALQYNLVLRLARNRKQLSSVQQCNTGTL